MSTTRKDDVQNHYQCGRCKHRIEYLSSEEATIPCPECGYWHKDRLVSDVPPIIKVDLTQF